MGFNIGIGLLLFGVALAFVSVFAWRSSLITGGIGLVLSTSCAVWLLWTMAAMDVQSAWSASPVSRAYYEVLVAACGVVAIVSVVSVVWGTFSLVRARTRARASIASSAPVTGMKACRHCGKLVPAQAIACRHCERDLHQRG
jgi:ribosomal protein L40E